MREAQFFVLNRRSATVNTGSWIVVRCGSRTFTSKITHGLIHDLGNRITPVAAPAGCACACLSIHERVVVIQRCCNPAAVITSVIIATVVIAIDTQVIDGLNNTTLIATRISCSFKNTRISDNFIADITNFLAQHATGSALRIGACYQTEVHLLAFSVALQNTYWFVVSIWVLSAVCFQTNCRVTDLHIHVPVYN